MKEYVFPGYCTFGKCDSGTSWIEFELTEEEESRLIAAFKDHETYIHGFRSSDAVSDIYDKIWKVANEQITEELLGMDEMLEEGEKASDIYQIWVNFPEEFEELYQEDKE